MDVGCGAIEFRSDAIVFFLEGFFFGFELGDAVGKFFEMLLGSGGFGFELITFTCCAGERVLGLSQAGLVFHERGLGLFDFHLCARQLAVGFFDLFLKFLLKSGDFLA